MPVYTYQCDTCGVVFDKLAQIAKRDDQECRSCGGPTKRQSSTGFSVKTPLDTSKKDAHTTKEIDRVVGASADQKWSEYEKKKEAKLAEVARRPDLKIVDMGIKPGEKFNPEALLGNAESKRSAEAYVEALEDKKARTKGTETWDKKGFTKVSI